jgi:hypothetical protein
MRSQSFQDPFGGDVRVRRGAHGQHTLVRAGRLDRGELAFQQARGEEVARPGGQPVVQFLRCRLKEDQARFRPPGQQLRTVGTLDRGTGHDR